MLKITAIGNLTHDVELKMNEATGKPYAILRIASDRRYKDKDGNKLTDFISIKVCGPLAERCAAFAWKGCKLAATGDFETITFADDPQRQPGFLINAEIAHLDGTARVRQQLASGRVIQQCFLNGQCRSQLLAGNQHFSFRVLAPCIQQLVGKHGIRFYRFHGLNQIGLCARDFQGLRLLCFLSNHVRINKRQLFQ